VFLRHSPTLLSTDGGHRRGAGSFTSGAALCVALLLSIGGCEDVNWPFHHAQTTPPPSAPVTSGGDDTASECADIRAQIRSNEEKRREAPVTSTEPEIVNAGLGKADKRIDDLRARYAELDCPSEESPTPGRVPPLPPAPGSANH